MSRHLPSSGILQSKLKLVPDEKPALTSSPACQTKMLSPYYLRGDRGPPQLNSWVSEAAIWS